MPKVSDCKDCLFFGGIDHLTHPQAFHRGFAVKCIPGGFGLSPIKAAQPLAYDFWASKPEHVQEFINLNESAEVVCRFAPKDKVFDKFLYMSFVKPWGFDFSRGIYTNGHLQMTTEPRESAQQISIFDLVGDVCG